MRDARTVAGFHLQPVSEFKSIQLVYEGFKFICHMSVMLLLSNIPAIGILLLAGVILFGFWFLAVGTQHYRLG